MPGGFVYIITNKHHTTLYVGVTSNLYTRSVEHREKLFPKSFTAKYNLDKLVYYEVFDSIVTAIKREKQLKGGSRKKKEALINKYNPEWKDLFHIVSDEEWNEAPLENP
jgi:putative endonuclease